MKTMIYQSDSTIASTLIKKDQRLAELFNLKKEIIVHIDDDYFVSLAHTIIAQQLSTKVATVLSNRLKDFCEKEITPDKILEATDESLRSLGLSKQKITYLKSLATHVNDHSVDFHRFHQMTDDEVIESLIQIKGIGVWSAQMFLMFSLGREDVFSYLDLGLRNAVKKLYDNEALTKNQIEDIASNWKPYRSIVSHYLWHAWDNT